MVSANVMNAITVMVAKPPQQLQRPQLRQPRQPQQHHLLQYGRIRIVQISFVTILKPTVSNRFFSNRMKTV